MKTEHTKAIYSIESSFDDCLRLVATTEYDKREIARFSPLISEKQADEIVCCVNERDALVAALNVDTKIEAADEQARGEWEDGEGAECVTTSGIWHAAIAYERKRLAAALQSPAPETK